MHARLAYALVTSALLRGGAFALVSVPGLLTVHSAWAGGAQVVAEARVRLVAGLKRYFHEKRAQGLLTGRGILVLDHACDEAMDNSGQPLLIWAIVERCAPSLACDAPAPLSHAAARAALLGACRACPLPWTSWEVLSRRYGLA